MDIVPIPQCSKCRI